MSSSKTTYEIAPGTKAVPCKGCGADIYWMKTKAGKNMPCNADGTSHFETCPKSREFSGKGKTAADQQADKTFEREERKRPLDERFTELVELYGMTAEVVDKQAKEIAALIVRAKVTDKLADERQAKLKGWANKIAVKITELEGKV